MLCTLCETGLAHLHEKPFAYHLVEMLKNVTIIINQLCVIRLLPSFDYEFLPDFPSPMHA